MNAYQKALQLGLTGTDAEIVATLRATGVTVRQILLSELLFLLNFRGMLTKLVSNNSDEKWAGTVLAMKAAISADAVATAHVDRWLSHITNPRNTHWDTTDIAYAAPFWAMAQALGGVEGMPSVADFTAVAALGGGWIFADLTTEQFTAQKEAAAKDVALELVTNTAVEAAREEHRKSEGTPESIIAAAKAILEGA